MYSKYLLLLLVVICALTGQYSYADHSIPKIIVTQGLYGDIAFSPDGKYLALSGTYISQNVGGVKVYEVSDWHELDTQGIAPTVKQCGVAGPIAWSLDSSQLFVAMTDSAVNQNFVTIRTAGDKIVNMWQTPTYPITAMLRLPASNNVVTFDGELDCYDSSSGSKIKQLGDTVDLMLSEWLLSICNNDLILGTTDGFVLTQNLTSGKIRKSDRQMGFITSLAVSRDNATIASAYVGEKVSRPKTATFQYVQLFKSADLSAMGDPIFVDNIFTIDKIIFDSDKRSIIVLLELPYRDPVTHEDKIEGRVEKLDIVTGKLANLSGPMRAMPRDIAESNDGHYLVCSTDNGLYIWSLPRS